MAIKLSYLNYLNIIYVCVFVCVFVCVCVCVRVCVRVRARVRVSVIVYMDVGQVGFEVHNRHDTKTDIALDDVTISPGKCEGLLNASTYMAMADIRQYDVCPSCLVLRLLCDAYLNGNAHNKCV